MANNSFQRVIALVQNDIKKHGGFLPLIGMYAVMQLLTTITYRNLWYVDIRTCQSGDEKVFSPEFLSTLYGAVNLPHTGVYHVCLVAVMFLVAFRKFTHKNESAVYRMLPATNWEKCLNLIGDYLVLVVGCLAIKAVFCVIFGFMMGDMTLALNALKGIFVGHAPSSGLYYQGSYALSIENMQYGSRLWGMSHIGIPFFENPWDSNHTTLMPIVLNQGLINVTSTGTQSVHFYICDWTKYPAFAFGLNTVHFLFCTFFDLLVITAFAIRKQGQKFFRTKEWYILSVVIAYFVAVVGSNIIFGYRDFARELSSFGDIFVEIFIGNGPWCWGSMNGWMVQSGILLIYLALTITYLYKKVKTL